MGPGKTDCLPNQNYNSTKALNCIRAIYKMIKKKHADVLDISQGCQRSLRQALCCHQSSGGRALAGVCCASGEALADCWSWPSGHLSGGSASWRADLKTRLCWGTPRQQLALWTGKNPHIIKIFELVCYLRDRSFLLCSVLSPCFSWPWSHRWEEGIPQGSRWRTWWLFRLDYTSLDLTPTQNVLLQHTGLDLEGSFSRLKPGWMGQCFYSIPWKGTI